MHIITQPAGRDRFDHLTYARLQKILLKGLWNCYAKLDDPQKGRVQPEISLHLFYVDHIQISITWKLIFQTRKKYKWSSGLDKIQSSEHRISRHPVITVIFPNENTSHFFPHILRYFYSRSLMFSDVKNMSYVGLKTYLMSLLLSTHNLLSKYQDSFLIKSAWGLAIIRR